MYAPCYYLWTQPYCMPAYSQPLYPNAASSPSCSPVYNTQGEISPLSQENGVKVSEESSERVKQEEEINKQESSSKGSRFKYPKKNVQSNVVNQVISYITTKSKSKDVLKKILITHEKIEAFYEILRQAKKKNRKYMGRCVLQSLLEIDEDHPIHILHRKLKPKINLKVSEIRKAMIKLTNYFLRNLIVPTLLTSSKLDKSTLNQHLLRAREILCYVNNKPYPSLI